MRPSLLIAPEDSLATATRYLRENGVGLLPIVSDERFHGVITEAQLAKALGDGRDLSDAVSDLMIPWGAVAPYDTGAEALRRLSELSLATLVVIDDNQRVLGILSASDLVPRTRPPIRPVTIGGMASPFGVYLTTGTASGGVSKWALMGTGAVMCLQLQSGAIATVFFMNAISPHVPAWLTSDYVQTFMTVGLFGLWMRVIPMSGIHAAEHQVVNAIERGEELDYEIVRRMPRVHPRCGTNLATGIGIFLGIFSMTWIPDPDARALIGVVMAWLFWRRLGSLAQLYVTTRPPTKKQLESGIRAGEQLLAEYSKARRSRASVPMWIWSSGLLQVIAGSSLCGGLLWVIGTVFHLPWLTGVK